MRTTRPLRASWCNTTMTRVGRRRCWRTWGTERAPTGCCGTGRASCYPWKSGRRVETVPNPERAVVLGQIVHHISDQLNVMGLFYNAQPAMIANRLKNVGAGDQRSTQAWNAEAWDTSS